ncbi:unnamed protein product, partial [Discosporangium mesarthrocarpum]
PDKDATIRCVCGVYRAHILEEEEEEDDEEEMLRVFDDPPDGPEQAPMHGSEPPKWGYANPVPSLQEVTSYYRDVFHRTKLNFDCIILSLVYIERLITVGGVE